MDKNDYEIMKRHMGSGGELELTNEDGTTSTMHIEQLDVEYLPDLILIQSELEKTTASNLHELDKDTLMMMTKLAVSTLKESIPKPAEVSDVSYEKTIIKFVSNNFVPLMLKIFEINHMGMTPDVANKINKIKSIQERVANAKAKGNAPDSKEGVNG